MPTAKDVTPSTWDWTGAQLTRDGFIALPFTVVPIEILIDEDDEVRGFTTEFRYTSGRVRRISLPTSVLRAARPNDAIASAGGPDLQLAAAKTVVAFLDDVRTEYGILGVPDQAVVTRAAWAGGALSGPGRLTPNGEPMPVAEWKPELSAYGHCAAIDQDRARELWREIVRDAMYSKRAMIVFGMPIGSIYCSPFRADSFALHITSESSLGKTESAEIAMSTLSSAERPHGALYRTWDASAQAPTNLMKLLGPLPVWFDETAVFAGDDTEFTNLLFRLAQGRGRLIADTEGGLRAGSGDRWDACVLSTGEARVSNRSGLTGLRRRVIEIKAPLSERGTHERMLERARAAYGWPLRWLMQSPDAVWARDLHLKVLGELGSKSKSQQIEAAQAANIATCVTGFGVLARLVGVQVSPRQLADAGAFVFGKILQASEDEGADIGERGLRAVQEAIQRTGYFHKPDSELWIQRWGVLYEDGYVGILGAKTLAEILKSYANLPDPEPVLDRWDEDGLLQHDKGTRMGRRQYFKDPQKGIDYGRMYLLKVG